MNRLVAVPDDSPHLLGGDPEHLSSAFCVQLEDKWDGFYIVRPNGHTTEHHFGELEQACLSGESAYNDHCPNPHVVRRYCEERDIYLSDLVDELITGRWVIYRETGGSTNVCY
jgi:hypothetical protein